MTADTHRRLDDGVYVQTCSFRDLSLALTFSVDGADKGIIPLTTSELFRRVEEKSSKEPTLSYTVEVSYIEIYNEK